MAREHSPPPPTARKVDKPLNLRRVDEQDAVSRKESTAPRYSRLTGPGQGFERPAVGPEQRAQPADVHFGQVDLDKVVCLLHQTAQHRRAPGCGQCE